MRPNWYLLIAVACWGLNFVAVKEAYKQFDPPALALLRFLVMWACLVALCLWKGESLRYPKADAFKLLYFGFATMGIYMVFFLEGMRGSGATEGSILIQLSPVFTALLAAALGQERFSAGSLSGALLALAGIVLIVYNPSAGHENKPFYNMVVVLAALCWAYCVTLMRPLLERHSPLRAFTLSMAGGLPVMLAYGLVPSLRQNWTGVTLYSWTMLFHIAVLSGVVAFLCFYQGVKDIGGTAATLYQFLVPVAAMIFGLLIRGTIPTILQLIGFAVVILGVWYGTRARSLAQAAAEA